MKANFREAIFKSSRSVFRLRDMAVLLDVADADNLKASVHYYAKKGVLRNIRRGVYVKDEYSVEELACRLYTPSYLSLETVLARAGIIFQYTSAVTAVSYLSRAISVDGHEIHYQKIKDFVLVDNGGIRKEGNVNVAIAERAFLDRLYLSKNYSFDNPGLLDRQRVEQLLPLYRCKALENRVRKVFKHGGY